MSHSALDSLVQLSVNGLPDSGQNLFNPLSPPLPMAVGVILAMEPLSYLSAASRLASSSE
jgi:hypothetical protein